MWYCLGKVVSLLTVVLVAAPAFSDPSLLDSVDPFLGAEAGGNTVPGATVPFGFVKASADCKVPWTNGWTESNPVLGISQTHVSGTGGSGKYGNFRITPWTSAAGELTEVDLSSDRADETARPGYYAITLTRQNVRAEVTATRLVAFHRYTFPDDEPAPMLLLDAGSLVQMYNRAHTQRMKQCSIRILPPNRMEGSITATGGWSNTGHVLHFSAEFDRPFAAAGVRRAPANVAEPDGRATVEMDQLEAASDSETLAGIARFAPGTKQVQAKIAVSFASPERARQHLEAQLPGWDFAATRSAAERAWEDVLSSVRVEGGSDADRVKLYTAWYRVHQMPTDLTGDNAGWESSADEPYYEDFFCLWDTFRGVHPLLLLFEPDRQRDMLNGLLAIYRHRGWLPDAWIGGTYGAMQGGTNADVLFADAICKGLDGVDYALAYEAMRKNADVQSDNPLRYGRDVADYVRLGYLPIDYAGNRKDQSYGRSASRTMEYAYNDFCIATVAKALGRDDEYQTYLARSQGWKKLWDSRTQSIRPRYADGRWAEQHDRKRRFGSWQAPFFQGSSWIYSTFVPHDAQGLIDLLGGDEAAVAWLDAFFDQRAYDQGNEPGFLAAYLYVHAGRPDKTSQRVRQILATQFGTGVRGLPGNDDAGAESAWAVSVTLGLYPNAGQPYYYLTAPVFPKATLKVWDGAELVIEAPAASEKNVYITGATLNGRPLDRAYLTHKEVIAGGTLHLDVSNQPNDWARTNRPPSVTPRQTATADSN